MTVKYSKAQLNCLWHAANRGGTSNAVSAPGLERLGLLARNATGGAWDWWLTVEGAQVALAQVPDLPPHTRRYLTEEIEHGKA